MGMSIISLQESADTLAEYLPIRMLSTVEDEYRWYLWNSYSALSMDSTSSAASFSIVPFHLLFMLVIQYKALRVSKEMPNEHKFAFTFRNLSHRNHSSLLSPSSPYDFSNMNERSLLDLFRLVGAEDDLISDAKSLIDSRNSLAHVSGVIESDTQGNIRRYLDVLDDLQLLFLPFNDKISNEWTAQMDPQDDRVEFVEARLASSYLCLADFSQGLLAKNFPR
jgi:hypothetical protein